MVRLYLLSCLVCNDIFVAAVSPNKLVSSSLPVLVAGDCHVVDVLCEVERRGCRVSLVIEGPVLFRTVVKQFRVRKIDPVLQRPVDIIAPRVGRDGRGLSAVVVPVNAIRNRRLETLFRRCRISGAAATDGAVVDYPLPGESKVT